MRRTSLLWQLFPSCLAITAASVLAVAWYASESAGTFIRERTAAGLEARARLAQSQVLPCLAPGDHARVDALCKTLGHDSDTRFTVILPDGQVVGDTDEVPEKMENHRDRPEIVQALSGEVGQSARYSFTLKHEMMYVAIPLRREGRIVGVLRASLPLADIRQALRAEYLHIAAAALCIVVLAGLGSYLVARRISRPLTEMKAGAELYASGQLAHRLPRGGSSEIAALAEAMNEMAAQLDERLQTLQREQSLQSAILTSMDEGVIAVGRDERIIMMNHAAARSLGVDGVHAHGRLVAEVIRNSDLQRFISQTAPLPAPAEIVLRGEGEKVLQVHATPLTDVGGKAMGLLVVVNDITRLRHLENVRREFVANVAHELRTPITSIKGFVETLQDGAYRSPVEAKRFLDILARQSDRLNAIVEDLLLLSMMEQDSGKVALTFQPVSLKALLREAVEVCESKARAKSIRLEVACSEDLTLRASAALLEQALVNLVDNAIKYSDASTTVRVDAGRQNQELRLSVRDEGPGIPPEHHARLFERFYTVDKARSRKLGGTGLGLAIVKHIAQLHGGRVGVESAPGKGSTFTINLPYPSPADSLAKAT
jgi:two-component system, OmpR family, phosphate regulon sensor histidine kinase PhoR